jgi:hypothetical protein
MARKVEEAANFVSMQLIEPDPGIYDKRHPDYAKRNKIHLAWEIISHEMNECRICLYVYMYYNQSHPHIIARSILLSDIAEKKFAKLAAKHTHLR